MDTKQSNKEITEIDILMCIRTVSYIQTRSEAIDYLKLHELNYEFDSSNYERKDLSK